MVIAGRDQCWRVILGQYHSELELNRFGVTNTLKHEFSLGHIVEVAMLWLLPRLALKQKSFLQHKNFTLMFKP